PRESLREVRRTHQIAVALAGGAAAFVDGPDDEALAAPAVAGGEDALDAGRVLLVFRLDVAAGVGLDLEILEDRLLGSEEAHREQHELRGAGLFGAGLFLRHKLALVVLLPFDLDGDEFLHAPLAVPDEPLDRGEINARIGPESRGGLFLAIIHLVDL